MTKDEFEKCLTSGSKISGVFLVLQDHQWHCRECEYRHVNITQIAGGSGIQGLQRGTKSRPGLVIRSDNHYCANCSRTTRHDIWDGQIAPANPTSSMSPSFTRRVIELLGSRDIVDGTERREHELTVDHKLPQIRWSERAKEEQTAYSSMSDENIREKFQLLKKSNGSVSHNLLKSRACENCFRTGNRGKPFGIAFFYFGGPNWEGHSKTDPFGCIGCGWYDFDKWREELNKIDLTDKRKPRG